MSKTVWAGKYITVQTEGTWEFAARQGEIAAAVIVAIDSPEEDARRYARAVAAEFVEIHLHAPADVRGARAGATGADVFEVPVQPELRLDTERLTLDEAGAEVLAWLQEWSSQS